MKILMVAPLSSHATLGRIAALHTPNTRIDFIDIGLRPTRADMSLYPMSLIDNYYDLRGENLDLFLTHPSPTNIVFDALRSWCILPEDVKLKKVFNTFVKKSDPDIIYAYYGSLSMRYIRLINNDFNLPIIQVFNTYPITLESENKIKRFFKRLFINEFVDYKMHAHKVTKYIAASVPMFNFANDKLKVSNNAITIIPDYLPKSFYCKNVNDKDFNYENWNDLVFLGAPERWGKKIDDIDEQLSEMSRFGLNVYISEKSAGAHYPFSYPYFSDADVMVGKLADHCNRFSAALITYNFSKPRSRFRGTLPTRFFSAISVGIPILVKRGQFTSVEEYVKKYNIGIVFDDYEHLVLELRDKVRLKRLRENAKEHSKRYFAESQRILMTSLFEELTNEDKT
ncbi:hypothetical protein N9P77_01680 [Amylibacter sp.]|nr:hypothetical protein [Amylibacter sp.]MDC0607875.1 hypothetical protein [Amylibacter sp.]